ncbi:MAG: hypothetical protein ACRCW3_03650 [Metamycoplasmataceae bacterium]
MNDTVQVLLGIGLVLIPLLSFILWMGISTMKENQKKEEQFKKEKEIELMRLRKILPEEVISQDLNEKEARMKELEKLNVLNPYDPDLKKEFQKLQHVVNHLKQLKQDLYP